MRVIMIDTRKLYEPDRRENLEAAAYLRRCGADITRVRKMFRDDIESYRAKAEAVRMAEVYRSQYAIAQCPGDIESPTVLAAQAANELHGYQRYKGIFLCLRYMKGKFI